MSAAPFPSYTFEEFIAAEHASDFPSEFVGGRVYAVSGGTERHDLMTTFVLQALLPGAIARGCRPFVHNRLVRLGVTGYYPDVMVTCGPAGHVHYETDLSIVVEVLSPSTSDHDHREKAAAYSSAAGFEVYILLDAYQPVAEVARPEEGWLRWMSHGPGSVIETSVGALDLDALHATVDRLAST